MQPFATLLCFVLASQPAATGEQPTQRVEMAKSLVDQMTAGEFEKAVEPFDETMKQVCPADKLKQIWNGLVAQQGPLQKTGDTRTQQI
jgi:hypothetical protein